MASNPMATGKKLMKELVEMDNKLSQGISIPKSDFDLLIGRLRECSRMALAYGAKIPMLGAIGGMTSQRIDNAIKRAQADVNNPKLYSIKDGMITAVTMISVEDAETEN